MFLKRQSLRARYFFFAQRGMQKKGQDRREKELRDSALSGACAGLVSSIVTCPLDVLKTRLQVRTERSSGKFARGGFQGVMGVAKKIWTEDGPLGFYRGLGAIILGYLPTWAIYFCVYDTGKRYFSEHTPLQHTHPFATHIASAMLAGATSTTCTTPMWVVKTRTMLQTASVPKNEQFRNPIDAFIKIYRSEGLTAFYKGLLPSLLGVFHVVVQFPLYEHFKSLMPEFKRGEPLSPGAILLCSSGSKMLASMATYPHEVLRTRLQMVPKYTSKDGVVHKQYASFTQTFWSILRFEGIAGFYRGMGVNLVRTVPNSGLTILTYEVIMHYLTTHSKRDFQEEQELHQPTVSHSS